MLNKLNEMTQGDILAGCLGVASHWATQVSHVDCKLMAVVKRELISCCNQSERKREESTSMPDSLIAQIESQPLILGAALASAVTKAAAWLAFEKHRRALTATAILDFIGAGFEAVEG